MFTGIVESIGEVVSVKKDGNNRIFILTSDLVPELKVDQSICHNGVCLTVEELYLSQSQYRISTVNETLRKTTLSSWEKGERVNLERSVTLKQRLDGHLVQGHVDEITRCLEAVDRKGSYYFTFELNHDSGHLIVPRGSITLDGISLTVAELTRESFSVAIIPFTYSHTTASTWEPGKYVNIEYDIFGKYMARYRELMIYEC